MDLIRTSYIATHTDEQVGLVLDRFVEAGRRIGLLHQPGSVESAGA